MPTQGAGSVFTLSDLGGSEYWAMATVLLLAILCTATWWPRDPPTKDLNAATLNVAPRPPALEHVQIGANIMGVGPGFVVPTAPESPEAVDIGPELAN